MGKGERRRHRRRHHHHHHHHHNNHNHIVGIGLSTQVVPGTERERRDYGLTLRLTIAFSGLGICCMIAGAIVGLSLVYIGVVFMFVAAACAVRAYFSHQTLKNAEASVASSQPVAVPQIANNPTAGQAGQNSATNVSYNPPTVFTIGGQQTSTHNMVTAHQPSEIGFGGVPYQQGYPMPHPPIGDVPYPHVTPMPHTTSQPPIGGAPQGVPYHQGFPMPHIATQPHVDLGLPTHPSGYSLQIYHPPYPHDQSDVVPTAGAPLADDNTVEAEPPPPSYEDVVNVPYKSK